MGSIAANPFQDVPAGRTEGLEALITQFREDTDPNRTDLLVGVYKTDEGKAIISTQTLGASGGCHVGAVMLKNHYGPWKENGNPEIFLPSESWLNHPFLFQSAGIKASFLPYLSSKTNKFDFASFTEAIKLLPAQSVILLQSGAQNPTGCDPSPDQWQELASIFIQGGHLAFFDAAYPGFASGDIDTDLEGVRLFAEREIPLVFVSTYGKCFGLYSERVGILSILAPSEEVGKRIERHMKLLARAESGAPPDFGSKIVETVLSDDILQLQWRQEVRDMANQLKSRRIALREGLEKLETPGNWQHITDQNGMFSYVGLSVEQVTLLRNKYHVYLQDSGRISIAGLNKFNIDYTARSISAVVKATKPE
ncbi:Pyridoxal phosphate-dependent transferase major region subdomain 2 [Penicillium vulpinum]|uniref:Pyridoxal phosphate-dependent transferase major region subdomain 2 n=1 Tax=Penicillium vulpinum TaxID=29845 RepID=UPI00254700AC|nr:Pyridoxal phosphate-dependent transferase major region subdomain 2 [Penicillium vulpinum]KAJ5951313.1 Pyridoxal phosphate-dependent transferase major region subdomain 2 [Penicillium vulpinum]